MLCKLTTLESYSIAGTNGQLGEVVDFLFADDEWVIRYLVVATGGWLGGRLILVSPWSIGRLEVAERELMASVTTEQVAGSPDVDMERPLSSSTERQLIEHYGYPPYWGGARLWGKYEHPDASSSPHERPEASEETGGRNSLGDAASRASGQGGMRHLRSGRALLRYCVDARNGEVGHIDGLMVDDRTWAIHQLVVSPRDSWTANQVLVEPSCIEAVNWNEESVSIGILREALRAALPLATAISANACAAVEKRRPQRPFHKPPASPRGMFGLLPASRPTTGSSV